MINSYSVTRELDDYFPWNVKSKFNFCGLWSPPVMKVVFGLHLVPRKCQISEVSEGFAPWTPTRMLPWTLRSFISCLRHDNHSIPHWFYVKCENLQKLRESWKISLISRDSWFRPLLYHPLYNPLELTCFDRNYCLVFLSTTRNLPAFQVGRRKCKM